MCRSLLIKIIDTGSVLIADPRKQISGKALYKIKGCILCIRKTSPRLWGQVENVAPEKKSVRIRVHKREPFPFYLSSVPVAANIS